MAGTVTRTIIHSVSVQVTSGPGAGVGDWLEIAKVAVPVLLGVFVWAIQALAQRAWTDYEIRRTAYAEVVSRIEALFEGGDVETRAAYLRAVRTLWLVGSDHIVRSANALSAGIRSNRPAAETEGLFRTFIDAMRHDLRSRRWLPPGRTTLTTQDFPVEGPGR